MGASAVRQPNPVLLLVVHKLSSANYAQRKLFTIHGRHFGIVQLATDLYLVTPSQTTRIRRRITSLTLTTPLLEAGLLLGL